MCNINQMAEKLHNKLLQELENEMIKVIKKYLPKEEYSIFLNKDSNYIIERLKLFGIEIIYTATSTYFEPRYIQIIVNGEKKEKIYINHKIISDRIEGREYF